MPWTTTDVKDHVKGLSDKQQEAWVKIANGVRDKCMTDGGTEGDCDAQAIKVASGMTKNMKEDGDADWLALSNLEEAATVKAQAKGLMRAVDALLQDRTIPAAVRTALDALHGALKKTWADLEDEAVHGPKPHEFPVKKEEMPMATETAAPVVQPPLLALETEPEPALAEDLAESATGMVEVLSEGSTPADHRGPLTLKVALIEPGFGNKQHNHYYSAEMLKRDAQMFRGVKMYESDHNQAEKSTRTWVSTVVGITGFTSSGAPIGEVLVHDPGFAERVRNLKTGGQLEQMACSILASGQVKAGKIGDQKANVVEAITSVSAVDWVTKAGAGGRALEIAESDTGAGQPEPKLEEVGMSAVEILTSLYESGLPAVAQKKLAGQTWADGEALKAAIEAERAYLAEVAPKPEPVAEGGKPFAQGAAKAAEVMVEDTTPISERESAILKRYLG